MTLNVPLPFDLLFLSDTQIAMPKGRNLVPWALFLLPHLLERYHLAPALLRRIRRLGFRFGRGGFHEAADLRPDSSNRLCGATGTCLFLERRTRGVLSALIIVLFEELRRMVTGGNLLYLPERPHIFCHRIFTHADRMADGFVTGVALVGLTILAP